MVLTTGPEDGEFMEYLFRYELGGGKGEDRSWFGQHCSIASS